MQRIERSGRWNTMLLATLIAMCGWHLALAQDGAPKQPATNPAPTPATTNQPAQPDPNQPTPPNPDQPAQPLPPTPTPPATGVVEERPWLTPEVLQSKATEINASAELTKEQKEAGAQVIAEATNALAVAAKARADAAQVKQDAELAPAATEMILAALKALDETPPPPYVPNVTKETTSKELQDQLKVAKEELAKWQMELAAKEVDIKGFAERQSGRRERVEKWKKDVTDLEAEAAKELDPAENKVLAEARRLRTFSRLREARAKLALEETRESSHQIRLALDTAKRDWAARQVKPAEQKVKALDDALAAKLKEEAAIAAAETQRQLQEAMNKAPQVAEIIRLNAADTKLNGELAQLRAKIQARPEAIKKQIEELDKELTALKERIAGRGLDQRVVRDLLKRRRTLPTPRQINREISQHQADLRSYEDKLDALQTQKKEFDDFEEKVKSIMVTLSASTSEEKRAEIEAEVRKLFSNRRTLINEQIEHYQALYSTVDKLEESKNDLRKKSAAIEDFIDTNLLWTADAPPISMQTATDLGSTIMWLISPDNWSDFVSTFNTELTRQAPMAALVILIFVVLMLLRGRIRRKLEAINADLKRIETDRFMLTPLAMLLTFVLALPWPVLIGGLSLVMRASWTASDFTRMIAIALTTSAISYLTLRTLIMFLKSGGIAQTHLRWRESTIGVLRRNLLWLMPIAVLCSGLIAGLSWLNDDARTDSLGRVAYIVFMIAITVFLFRVLNPRRGVVSQALRETPDGLAAKLRWFWFPVAILLPPVLAIVAAIGYFYTAQAVGGARLLATMWLMLTVLVAQSLLLRWLFVAQRKLALQKAIERREAKQKAAAAATEKTGEKPGGTATEEGTIAVEQPTIDLAQINEQTRQMIRATLTVGTAVGLYLIWAGVLPALRVLDEVNLWQYGESADEGALYVTLASVLLAIVITFITVAASKNVPGLLEITILKRTPMDAGARYAFATVSRYIITTIGIILAFQAIGIGWSSVQWLVAAVSLGLGFGLQEIFANFVSGLIVLFERPIRVGDVVTVGNVSGVVSRIRMRATSITDFDRKEYIVPNKEFVTGRVLNWTLTDKTNRIVIPVGIAYGSDTEKAREILLGICRDHPLILDEPKSIVAFEGFGDSTLNFVVRTFLPNLDNRLEVIHQLHTRIHQELNKAGIEIAFPQRDLHLRSVDSSIAFLNGSGNGKGDSHGGERTDRGDRAQPSPQESRS